MKRAAIIGCGDVSVIHAEGLAEIDGVQLVAVCDNDPERARIAGERYAVPWFTHHRELMEKVEFDVGHVTTPHNVHAPVTIDLLDAGYHVIQEKPLAESLEAGRGIIAAAERANGKIGICFQNRYNVSSQTLAALLDTGELGAITGAHANVVWSRDADYYHARPWRGTWAESGGGLLMNQAVHTIDLLHWFMGGIESVQGSATCHKLRDVIEVEDTAHLYLTHPNGTTSTMYATLANPVFRPVQLELYTENATAIIGDGLEVNWQDGRRDYYPERKVPTCGRTYWGVSHEILFRNFYATLDSPEPFWLTPRDAYESLKAIQTIYDQSSLR